MKFLSLSLVCGSALLLAGTAEASITITSSELHADAFDGFGSSADPVFTGTTIPTSQSLNALDTSSFGTSRSNNTISWSATGGQTVLSFDMDHVRNGSRITSTSFAFAQTYDLPLSFTANANETYQLSGFYNVADVSGTLNNQVEFGTDFYDVTADNPLFSDEHQSNNTHSPQFVLGASGGDTINDLSGSLTGNLIAGHNYEFSFLAYISAVNRTDLGASASGNFTLTITDVNDTPAVPEPLSLMVWVGLIATTAIGTGRRTRN